MATIDDFGKLEFKVGTVLEASEVEGSERLLKLKVDLGPIVTANATEESIEKEQIAASLENPAPRNDEHDIRQILSGIKQWYSPEDLIGKQFVFITNLEPRMMMGLESNGMLLCADGRPSSAEASEGQRKPIPLIPQEQVPNGSKIR